MSAMVVVRGGWNLADSENVTNHQYGFPRIQPIISRMTTQDHTAAFAVTVYGHFNACPLLAGHMTTKVYQGCILKSPGGLLLAGRADALVIITHTTQAVSVGCTRMSAVRAAVWPARRSFLFGLWYCFQSRT